MIKLNKALVVIGILMLLIFLIGCQKDAIPKTEILKKISNTQINSTKFKTNVTAEILPKDENEDKTVDFLKILTKNHGEVDYLNQKMHLNTDIKIKTFLSKKEQKIEEINLGTEVYVLDNTAYSRVEIRALEGFLMPFKWVKTGVPEDFCNYIGVKVFLETLKNSEIQTINNEKIDDIECYVIELTPNTKVFQNYIMNQIDTTGLSFALNDLGMLQNKVQNINAKFWVRKSDFLPIKEEYTIISDIDEKKKLKIEIVTEFYDINHFIEIKTPEDIKNAVNLEEIMHRVLNENVIEGIIKEVSGQNIVVKKLNDEEKKIIITDDTKIELFTGEILTKQDLKKGITVSILLETGTEKANYIIIQDLN